jgi:hypothetical protein
MAAPFGSMKPEAEATGNIHHDTDLVLEGAVDRDR